MGEHVIAREGALDDGERVTVQVEGREVTVFNIEGEYHAYTNWCAHQSGPVCEGTLTGTRTATVDEAARTIELEYSRDGKILSCPWHGWEYDVVTGECLSKNGVRLPAHPVRVEDERIVVTL